MPLALFATPTPAVVHAASSGSGWVTYVVGAASALVTALIVQLVVQFLVVPRVETRKRREDRWEHDVRQLHELVAMRLPSVANDTWAAQALYREARDDQTDEYGPDAIRHRAREAEKAGFAFGGLIGPEMDMLVDRALSINRKAPELVELERLYKDYEMQSIFVRPSPHHDDRTAEEFKATWGKEHDARDALTAQVKLLANMRHPPS